MQYSRAKISVLLLLFAYLRNVEFLRCYKLTIFDCLLQVITNTFQFMISCYSNFDTAMADFRAVDRLQLLRIQCFYSH